MEKSRLMELAGVQLDEAVASVNWDNVCSIIAKEVIDSAFKANKELKTMSTSDRADYVLNDIGEDIDSFMNEKFEKHNIMDKISKELDR